MNVKYLLLILTSLIIIPLTSTVFAQTSYDVNIPTGAASPDAPYFWQSEKDGSTTGDVQILIGDTVVWKNADTAAHTVTSGTASDGPDDLFDSGLFGPGKSFSYKFTDTGDYPYYCIVHPWMEGTILVTAGYSIIPNVGQDAGDGSTHFDVEYDFNRVLSTSAINEEQKSLTFEIIGEAKSDNHDLELRLPAALIDGPFVIWVDGEKTTKFELIRDGDISVLMIPLESDSEILTIVGTSVVPEFGSVAMMILVVSIVVIILASQKFRTSISSRF